jgi:response regulator RpfG family c-di-GMP phosphodiesterase
MSDLLHVLCVDDEPKVLEGLSLNLRRHFRVSTAVNGKAGLAIVESADPPAVVVSDMRMPEMDGASFLSHVRERSPDTVRLLLTGQTDIESAIAAVNRGQIFRFLTKPCSSQIFLLAVQAAAEQHRLIVSERVLLEQTLRGSIKALIDILSLANPLAFGRANRLKQSAAQLVKALDMPVSWQIEIAAMLSQIGCITLPPGTGEKLYYGKPLNSDENDLVQHLPALAAQILESIPRLEAVRAILQMQAFNYDGSNAPIGSPKADAIPLGARVLKIVTDYDSIEASGVAPDVAAGTLQGRKGRYDSQLLDTFVRLKAETAPTGITELGLGAIRAGMFLAQDVVSATGLLLVARGQEVTIGLLQRLRNLPKGAVHEPIAVFVPSEQKKTV